MSILIGGTSSTSARGCTGLCELETFQSDSWIFVTAPLAPIFFLHLLSADAREDFFHSERGFVERVRFTAAGF